MGRRQKGVLRIENQVSVWEHWARVPCRGLKREIGRWHFRVFVGSALSVQVRCKCEKGEELGTLPVISPPAPNSFAGFQCPIGLQISSSLLKFIATHQYVCIIGIRVDTGVL